MKSEQFWRPWIVLIASTDVPWLNKASGQGAKMFSLIMSAALTSTVFDWSWKKANYSSSLFLNTRCLLSLSNTMTVSSNSLNRVSVLACCAVTLARSVDFFE